MGSSLTSNQIGSYSSQFCYRLARLQILHSKASFDTELEAVKFLPILLVALLFCVPTLRTQEVPTATGPLIAQSSESRQVWVNTASGIYHYRGARWYGKTKQGKYMSEVQAKAYAVMVAQLHNFHGPCER
jgi:hypothetical protein